MAAAYHVGVEFGNAGDTTSTSSALTTTGGTGSALVISLRGDPALPPFSVTDSKGNTYTLIASKSDTAASGTVWVYGCMGGVGGSGHTVSVRWSSAGTSQNWPTCSFIEYLDSGGAALSVSDVFTGVNSGGSGTGYTVTTGTFSTGVGLCHLSVFTDTSGGSPNTYTDTTGTFTVRASQPDGSTFWVGADYTAPVTPPTALTGSLTCTFGFIDAAWVGFGLKSTSGSPALTAVSAAGSVGSITLGVGVQLNLSGNSSASNVGTTKANVTLALTGVSATGSVGTVSAGPPILSNVTATGSVGTAKANAQLNLSGTSAASAVSNVGAGISATPGAVSSAGSTGAVGPALAPAISAVIGTFSVGSVGAGIAQPLSAVSSTTSLTSVGANISVALTSVSSTCSVGSVRPPGTQLGPVTATCAAGSLGLTVAHALSGTSSTLTPGGVQSTPQLAISGVTGTGSVGTVRFGNVVVGLAGVTAIGSVGTVLGPIRPDTGNGELFAAQQMAQALTYTNLQPVPNQRGAILYDSGSWTVPLGAKSIFVSATAAGGTPRGRAGEQVFRMQLPVQSGQQINVNFLSNGDVSLYVGSTLLLYLFAGPAGGQDAWQSTLGKSSGIPGDFGSGVDAGRAHPPIVVLFWSPS